MKIKQHTIIPYGDRCTFFASGNTAVPTWTTESGKGWYDVHVGGFVQKARYNDTHATKRELLSRFYPGHRNKISFYADLSYHSSLNRGTAGKITKYGTTSNHVGYTTHTKQKTYDLLWKVMTSSPKSFGEEKSSLTSYIIHYLTHNWRPKDGGEEWFVEYNISSPDGDRKGVFKSDGSVNPAVTMKIFRAKVQEMKRRK